MQSGAPNDNKKMTSLVVNTRQLNYKNSKEEYKSPKLRVVDSFV